MRLFLAVPIPFTLQQQLDSWWQQQKLHFAGWRSMPQSNRHLTLHFLGDVEGRHLDGLCDALSELFSETLPLSLDTQGYGFFPKPSRATTFWVGVKENDESGELKRCASRCRHVCQPFQQKHSGKATPFRGHITMARHSLQIDAGDLIQRVDEPLKFSWIADEIQLISSQLPPQGALYQTVERFELGILGE